MRDTSKLEKGSRHSHRNKNPNKTNNILSKSNPIHVILSCYNIHAQSLTPYPTHIQCPYPYTPCTLRNLPHPHPNPRPSCRPKKVALVNKTPQEQPVRAGICVTLAANCIARRRRPRPRSKSQGHGDAQRSQTERRVCEAALTGRRRRC